MALFWALPLLQAAFCWALSARELLHTGAPGIFVKKEFFSLPAGARSPAIQFGNSEIGYFVQKRPAVKEGRVELSFVPPTYRKPVEFTLLYSEKDGKPTRQSLGSKRYVYPVKDIFMNPPRLSGHLSFPFFLLNGTVVGQGPSRTKFFPMIMNRLGEVVWFAARRRDFSFRSIMLHPIGNGEFLFLKRANHSFLQIMNAAGQIRKEINFRERKLPPNSHAFKYLPSTEELLYLSYDCRELPWYKEFVPLFSGPVGWWRLLTLPRRTYRGGKLVRLALNTGEYKEVWSAYNDFSPEQHPSLFYGMEWGTDRFMDVRTPEDYLRAKSEAVGIATWGEHCDVDWTHENSVDYRPGEGFLISIRNLNLLVLVGEDGKLKWKMGEDSRSDFTFLPGMGFSMQHAATFLPNGDILLFDNNVPYRGYSGLRMANRLMVLGKPELGKRLEIKLQVPLHAPQSYIRGSVSILPNGNYFAYAPGVPGGKETVLEVGPKNVGEMSKIEYGGDLAPRGIEAKPLMAIGTEELVGEARAQSRPAKEGTLSPATLIDTTY